jgi:hypothetical protein
MYRHLSTLLFEISNFLCKGATREAVTGHSPVVLRNANVNQNGVGRHHVSESNWPATVFLVQMCRLTSAVAVAEQRETRPQPRPDADPPCAGAVASHVLPEQTEPSAQ